MKRFNLYLGAALSLCALVAGFGFSFPPIVPDRSKSESPQNTQTQTPGLPEIESRVKGVTLENLRLSDDEKSVKFDIVNKTAKPILSLTVRSGNSSQTYNAYGDEVFIEPGAKSDEGRYYLSNMRTKAIVVTAVEFFDGELRGTESDKEWLLVLRERKAKGRAKRAHRTVSIANQLKSTLS